MKLRINSNGAVLILGLVIIPLISIIFPPAGVAVMTLAIIYYMLRRDSSTLLFFVCSIVTQNITLLIGANRYNSTLVTLYSLSKEILLYGCVAIIIVHSQRIKKKSLYFLFFVLVIFGAFIFSDAPTYAKIVSIRQFMLPFVCFFFGAILKINESEIKTISKYIMIISLVVGAIGVLEVFVFQDEIWTMLPIARFQENKGAVFELYNGVPLNFYTFDYFAIVHKVLRRLVSTFTDPLMTGHFLFLGLVLTDLILKKGTKRIIIKLFFVMCSFLTLSKGVFLSFLCYFALSIIKRYSYETIRNIIFMSVGLIVAGFIGVYEISTRFLSNSSILIHMNGFVKGITNGGIIGRGLGKAGVMVYILVNSDESIASESYIGVMASQIGLIGVMIFITFWMIVFFKLIRFGKQYTLCYVSEILLISVLLESFFSESSIGIVGTGLYFIFAGISLKQGSKILSSFR